MKGQVSAELIAIIGLVLALFIPLLLTVYVKTNESNQQLYNVQAELVSTRLAYLINSVGNLGQGSSILADVFIPPYITRIQISNLGRGSQVIVRMNTPSGESEISDAIRFSINPASSVDLRNPRQGLRRFNISYIGEYVVVRVV